MLGNENGKLWSELVLLVSMICGDIVFVVIGSNVFVMGVESLGAASCKSPYNSKTISCFEKLYFKMG